MVAALGTFAAIFAIVLGAYWLFVARDEGNAHQALRKRLRPQEESAHKSKGVVTKSRQREAGPALFRGLQSTIDQSGRKVTIAGLVFACGMAGFVAGLAVWMAAGEPLIAFAAGALVAMGPYSLVKHAATKRMRKFEEQFPEAIDLIGRALRAGHALPTGLSMVAEELGDPVGPEFKLLYDRQNFGMPITDALRSFAARVPIIDARFFVTAVLTQREAGGNLSGVLDNLSAVIRERFKVKRQVGVISAQGRLTAAILVALPVAVGVMQFVMAPANLAVLIHDPLGKSMLLGAVGMQLVGILWIRKIVRIEYLNMPPLFFAGLMGAFVAVALLSGALAYEVMERQAPGRRRLQEAATGSRLSAMTAPGPGALTDYPTRGTARLARFVPKSPGEMNKLRRRLVRAGYHSLTAAVVFSVAEVVTPFMVGLPLLLLVRWPLGLACGALGAIVGFMLPGLVLGMVIERRRVAITNGLPDVLDLLIVCLEAGCSLDQAIVKCTDELSITHPTLGDELRMLNTETRAGKPRIEAFKNLEARTKNEDIKSLVAMLVQTDRFGTSVSQALRTFAEVTRTKRRQRAEEKAAKVSVKMMFPLVLFIFPALYVVLLGAAVIQFRDAFFGPGGIGR